MKRGARTPPRHRLDQYLEFMTNQDASTTIQMEHRNNDGFNRHIIELNLQYGRRARDLVVQPDEDDQWGDGIYSVIKLNETKYKLQHNFMEDVVKVIVLKAECEYFLDTNYSEAKAAVKCHNGCCRKVCSLVFAEVVARNLDFQKSPAKKIKAKHEHTEVQVKTTEETINAVCDALGQTDAQLAFAPAVPGTGI